MAELRGLRERRRCRSGRGRLAGAAIAGCALLLGITAGLAPAPAAAQDDPERGYATQPFTPKTFQMPEGQGCAGDVARWRAVQDNDYASGNIGLKVYHQIKDEIGRADAACRAGRDGEAQAMVHASKRQHGYPD